MHDQIISESFSVTPAIRHHLENDLKSIHRDLPNDGNVKIFLGRTGPRTFKVTIVGYAWGKPIVTKVEQPDFYIAMTLAKNNFIQKLRSYHDKKVKNWRRKKRTMKGFYYAPQIETTLS